VGIGDPFECGCAGELRFAGYSVLGGVGIFPRECGRQSEGCTHQEEKTLPKLRPPPREKTIGTLTDLRTLSDIGGVSLGGSGGLAEFLLLGCCSRLTVCRTLAEYS
jgi:hypothetical protein